VQDVTPMWSATRVGIILVIDVFFFRASNEYPRAGIADG